MDDGAGRIGNLRPQDAGYAAAVFAHSGRRLLFTFGPEHEHLRNQVESRRGELEKLSEQLAGRRVPIATMRGVAASPDEPAPRVAVAPPPPLAPDADLRARALADANVQALLEIIPAEIRDVEEM